MIVEPKREILLGPLLRAGVRRSWAARDHFVRLGVLPLALMIAILVPLEGAVNEVMFSADPTRLQQDGGPMPMMVLLLLAYIAVLTVFAVNWLRQLTLGMSAVPGIGLTLSGRNIRFFVFMVTTFFASGALAVILSLLLSPVGLPGVGAAIMVSVLAWAVMLARLSPSWIGIAIDAPMPLGAAWRRTAGQGFKLLIALLAVDVPAMFLRQLITSVFVATGLLDVVPLTFTLITAFIQLASTAVQLAVLVTAFPYFLRETV